MFAGFNGFYEEIHMDDMLLYTYGLEATAQSWDLLLKTHLLRLMRLQAILVTRAIQQYRRRYPQL
jgi:hypothetical protein